MSQVLYLLHGEAQQLGVGGGVVLGGDEGVAPVKFTRDFNRFQQGTARFHWDSPRGPPTHG
jgi:hypothetical protein